MAHSFVLARFNPTLTATKAWMNPTVVQAANSITCRSFLALAIALDKSHAGQQFGYNVVLFPISPRRPRDEFAEYYATISFPPTKQAAFLRLGLPSQSLSCPPDSCYLHTVPALYLKTGLPSSALPFQLETESLQQLQILAGAHQLSWFQAISRRRTSGGEESVQDGWDSWSGENLYRDDVPPGSFTVEYLDPDDIDLTAIEPPHVLDELMIFKKLTLDYNRKRMDELITWCLESRKSLSTNDISDYCARHPDLDGEVKDQAIVLYQMRIPVDRQPIPDDTSEEAESDSEEDGADPIGVVCVSDPPVPLSDVRVVLFDSIGSLFDRQTSILRALRLLDPVEFAKHEPEYILKSYFEAESILLCDYPEWEFHRVVELALKNTLYHLGALIRCDLEFERACEAVLRLDLYPDAEKTIEALSSLGITVVGLSMPGASSFVLPPLPQSFIFDSYSQDTSALLRTSLDLFSNVFERLRSFRDDLEGKEQVLVVTTGRFRVLEPAHLSGYPTALIQHNLESKVDLHPSCTPTLLVPGGLNELQEKLATFHGISTTVEGTEDYVFAVRTGPYQGVEILGKGSFGEVCGGVHVLTGAPVAIKHDSPGHAVKSHDCKTSVYPCSLPYEAQVYRALGGGQGFPSLRWYHVQEGAHVLVLDKLGPDLDAVRLLCRGHLSLKTVLMLGLQMLERVEYVHSRGLILRDLKPQNFVMGLGERCSIVHLLDFGLVRPYMNPITNEHIPFVDNLERVGTARFTSYNMLCKQETSRRDDIEALGNVLLYLLRGRLPWQGIYAPSIEAKYVRLAEMRVGKTMQDFIDKSAGRDLWHAWFKHCRELAFTDKPDYDFLRDHMSRQINECGGMDGRFDWLDGTLLEHGTLIPGEYKLDASLFHDDFPMMDLIPVICQ